MKSIAVGILLAGLALMTCVGCQDKLFPQDAARSPYSRYQSLRGQEEPMTMTDPYGNEQPALRARLTPMGAN